MAQKNMNFRLNTDKMMDDKVLDILQSLPNGRKSEYIRNSIVFFDNNAIKLKMIEKTVEKSVSNAIEELDIKTTKNNYAANDNMAIMMDFVKTL